MSLWLVKSSRVALFLSREQWQLWGQQWVRAPLQLSCEPGLQWLSGSPLTGQIRTSTTPALSGKAQAGQPYCAIIPQDRLVVVPCVLRLITFFCVLFKQEPQMRDSSGRVIRSKKEEQGILWCRENNRLECPLCSWICNVQYFSVSVSQQMNHIINSDDCGLSNQCLFSLPYFKAPKELTLKTLWSLAFFSMFFLDLTELIHLHVSSTVRRASFG